MMNPQRLIAKHKHNFTVAAEPEFSEENCINLLLSSCPTVKRGGNWLVVDYFSVKINKIVPSSDSQSYKGNEHWTYFTSSGKRDNFK